MEQSIILIIVGAVITAVVSIISYFLKRTIDELKDVKNDIKEITLKLYTLQDKYATKEELKEIKESISNISDDIKELSTNTVCRADFIRITTDLATKLDLLLRR
jgi:signal transduction histidine kinase